MKIKIIPVENQELILLTEKIAFEIWREHYASIITSEQIEYMLEKFQSAEAIAGQMSENGYKYFLVNDNSGGVNGYFAVSGQEENLFLSKLYIHKNSRGKGFGKASLSFIKDFAKKNNYKYIWLTVNKNNLNSIEAYKKMGFVIDCEIKQDIGNGFIMDDYKMVLAMAPQASSSARAAQKFRGEG
ncbi:MAG: GNAT family N-acetyltransferase [Endomicrobia bacterium]|nr:GNAT family N-acetyltransferase [Endomicrobiia bacterium]MCL2145320.1 GNAT family N-acetyltransferase [Endomicrobiia bacterium]